MLLNGTWREEHRLIWEKDRTFSFAWFRYARARQQHVVAKSKSILFSSRLSQRCICRHKYADMTYWTHISSHWTQQNKMLHKTSALSAKHSPSLQHTSEQESLASLPVLPPIPTAFPSSLTASAPCPLTVPSKQASVSPVLLSQTVSSCTY